MLRDPPKYNKVACINKGGTMATRSGGPPIKNVRKVKPGPDQAFTLPKGTSAAPINKQVKLSKIKKVSDGYEVVNKKGQNLFKQKMGKSNYMEQGKYLVYDGVFKTKKLASEFLNQVKKGVFD